MDARPGTQRLPAATDCRPGMSSIPLDPFGGVGRRASPSCLLHATGARWNWPRNMGLDQLHSRPSAPESMATQFGRQRMWPSNRSGRFSRMRLISRLSFSVATQTVIYRFMTSYWNGYPAYKGGFILNSCQFARSVP